MKSKYRLYDKINGYIFEFKTKQQLNVHIVCLKDEYKFVNLTQISEYEYEIEYYELKY